MFDQEISKPLDFNEFYRFSIWSPVLSTGLGASLGALGGFVLAPPGRIVEGTLYGAGIGALGGLVGNLASWFAIYLMKKLDKKPAPWLITPFASGLGVVSGLVLARRINQMLGGIEQL